MRQLFIATTFLTVSIFITGCLGPKLTGKVVGETYISARQNYSIPFPVDPGMGGRVAGDSTNENDNGVIFVDDLGSRVSFYALPFDANTELAKSLQSEGREKTLDWVLRKFYASSITIHYHPDIRDGTSSFLITKTEPNRTVKAGVAVFIQGNRTYIVETDLADVTKALWHGTMEEQDQWLEKRALELVQTIQIK